MHDEFRLPRSCSIVVCLLVQAASVVHVMKDRAGGVVSPKPHWLVLQVMGLQVRSILSAAAHHQSTCFCLSSIIKYCKLS